MRDNNNKDGNIDGIIAVDGNIDGKMALDGNMDVDGSINKSGSDLCNALLIIMDGW